MVLPPRCSGCGDITQSNHIFCGACWVALNFIQKPFCQKCGVSLPYEADDLTCVNCLAFPPVFDLGRSSLRYDGLARDLILRLKHGDATYLPPSLASWIIQAGQDFWSTTDYIIPVPLHRWRLFKRRYNQATLLARVLRDNLNIPILTNVLVRSRFTQSQGDKTRKERRQNVNNAFAIKDSLGCLKGKTIVLVDDVWTTGATLEACTKVLKKKGVEKVFVLTLSRVIKE